MDSEVGASEPTMLLGAFSTTVKPFHAQSWSSGMKSLLRELPTPATRPQSAIPLGCDRVVFIMGTCASDTYCFPFLPLWLAYIYQKLAHRTERIFPYFHSLWSNQLLNPF
jgi:hypothetical protein